MSFNSIKNCLRVVLLVSLLNNSHELQGKLSFWEESDYKGDGHIFTKADNSSLQRLNYKTSGCMVGMWNYVSLGDTNSYGLASYATENCDREYMFSPSALKFVRPLANPDTSKISLSLYEEHLATLEMVREHYFEQRTWMGIPFRIYALAVTGWSNWTISEFPNFEGKIYCIRSTQEFQYVNGLHTGYPLSVGSVAQGCHQKADYTIYLPRQDDHLVQVAF